MFRKLNFYKYLFLPLVFIGTFLYGNDENSPCSLPSNLSIKSVSLNSAKIGWINNAEVKGWKIKWRIKENQYQAQDTSGLITTNFYEFINLASNKNYFFRIKTICKDSESDWSNEYNFVTFLTNPSDCDMKLTIKDPGSSNQVEKTLFYIQNNDFENKFLGEDVFIQNIHLILKHDWTSDIDIKLTSPSGKSVSLIKNLNFATQKGFGNLNSQDCKDALIFSDLACSGIAKDKNDSIIGIFIPKEPISSLYDASSPVGTWILEISDKAKNNIGTLKYFNIEFAPLICPVPEEIRIIPESNSEIKILWKDNLLIDSVLVNVKNNEINKTFKIKNNSYYLINELNDQSEYQISLQSKCFNNISAFSCEKKIQTLCNKVLLKENFDDKLACEDPCFEDCLNSEFWYNSPDHDKRWLINEKSTSTENTGPDNGVYDHGKYIYLESSPGNCEHDTISILQSVCLKVTDNADGCDMSFNYHMFGADIGSLSLEISTDAGNSWQSLFIKSGNMGNQWNKVTIDLQAFKNKVCLFRFVGKTKKDKAFGDIGLDEILFFNVLVPNNADYTYFVDKDKDGFGFNDIGKLICIDLYPGYVNNNTDCDDDNDKINPNAVEIKCNFIDENCNGNTDDSQGDKPLKLTLIDKINESCAGQLNGIIILKVEEGIPPYKFLWSNGSTDSILINVGKGDYYCKISDKTGCGIISPVYSVDLNNTLNIQVADLQNTICNGNADGYIKINVAGGIEPITYSWSNESVDKNIFNLNAGLYSVTVSDDSGCTGNLENIEIKALKSFNVGIVQSIKPSCFGSKDGKLEIKVLDGIPPYTYKWNYGQTGKLISGLSAGNYFCTISDNANCSETYGPIILNEPEKFEIKINSIDHVSCIGQENGNIEISVKGGEKPYSFQWTSPDFDDFISFGDDIYNLRSGLYSLFASDKNGCRYELNNVEIETLDSINASIVNKQDVSCAKSGEGLISLSPSNGYNNYYYLWNNGSNKSFVDSLNAGTYSVTVTDDLGCKFVINNIEIENLNIPLDVDLVQNKFIKCFGDKTAELIAEVDSYSIPLDFNWSSGDRHFHDSSSDTISNLTTGIYTLTVTDNSGCTGVSKPLVVVQSKQMKINEVSINEIDCYGDNSGYVELDISGGIEPYSVIWNDSLYSGNKLIKLKAGKYVGMITDKNECQLLTDTIELIEPAKLNIKIITTDAGKNQINGTALLLIEGGVSPYEIQWDENTGYQTGQLAINLAKGWYNATITDYNNCTEKVQVFINETSVATSEPEDLELILFPNPAKENVNLFIRQKIIDEVKLFDQLGNIGQVHIQKSDSGLAIIDISYLNSGLYYIIIRSEGRYYIRKLLKIE
jgi:subtilisin-like proprotein convertase family protein